MLTWTIIGILGFIVMVYLEAEQRLRVLRLERTAVALIKRVQYLETVTGQKTIEPDRCCSGRTMWGDR